jgi:hypothetical protein
MELSQPTIGYQEEWIKLKGRNEKFDPCLVNRKALIGATINRSLKTPHKEPYVTEVNRILAKDIPLTVFKAEGGLLLI